MYSIDQLFKALDNLAPLTLSKELIASGDYDNSGVLVNAHNQVKRVLFSIDLSKESVKRAISKKCDTIVTHHPAIYTPVKNLNKEDALFMAVNAGINVISMHLNLDITTEGIDHYLAIGLGGKNPKIISLHRDEFGYGREFSVKEKALSDIVKEIKREFNTKRVVLYGKATEKIDHVASFCGAGSSYVSDYIAKGGRAKLIVTSDLPHHVIKEVVESGKSLVALTHYSSENYGFKRVFEKLKNQLSLEIECLYFEDKRFM